MTAGTPPIAPDRTRSLALPGFARGDTRSGLRTVLMLVPALIIAIGFLFYPLVFIVQMSFTEGSSYLSPAGPI